MEEFTTAKEIKEVNEQGVCTRGVGGYACLCKDCGEKEKPLIQMMIDCFDDKMTTEELHQRAAEYRAKTWK